MLVAAAVAAGGYTCGPTVTPTDPTRDATVVDPGTDPPVSDPSGFIVNGTVVFAPLEGGCWTLVADGGTTYEPYGLGEDYRVDGLRVRAALKQRSDLLSTCMIGTITQVLWIKRVD